MHDPSGRLRRRFAAAAMVWWVAASAALGAGSAELGVARGWFNAGKYAECLEACAKAIEAGQGGEGWYLLKVRGEMATGRYAQALKSAEAGIEENPQSLPMRMAAYDALRLNGRPNDADRMLGVVRAMAERAPWRFNEASGRVALGRALLRMRADARQVLELFYDRAKKDSPGAAEPWLASGELALEKNDFALAAEAFAEAAKRSPGDPDVYLGLARSYPNDSERATEALTRALEINPRHVESLLFQADNLIDREAYPQAGKVLQRALEVNAGHPRAWAYRAVLAHLAPDAAQEEKHRAAALATWKTNPEVDHLIGLKLSQKYRFAEGAACQRRALAMDAGFGPAKLQLCQDLLRLGEDQEGWRLAAEIAEADKYDVVAYNLVTLHEELAKFRTLRNDHFIVRMDDREAEIYGQRVLKLLESARRVLSEKYGVELTRPVTVEIFPRQQDFAIRTFGLPGGAGFLGVCFGPVVTVNSPASRPGRPTNWEAILWHEFCHTITLARTRNRMPRWLSEGISVYEERQQNAAWGQAMNPHYRELILAGAATPVSGLSGAFLNPPSPMHLQLAYYQSSMVVEYVVERFGAAALGRVLEELAADVPINVALARHTEPVETLDEGFAAWLRRQAEGLGKDVDWRRPESLLDADSASMAAWNKGHPNSFWGLLAEGRALIAERKWRQAKGPLEQAIALYPGYGEPGGPYVLLATVHRELGETQSEREALEKQVALNSEALEARSRLMEIALEKGDWEGLRRHAEQALAINPLTAAPHRHLARAAEALGDRPLAIEAHRTLLLLDPLDRAGHHYRLAQLLAEERRWPEARREVVRALEEAPRYRAGHALLLEIVGRMENSSSEVPAPAPASAPVPAPAAAPASVVPSATAGTGQEAR